MSCCFSFQFQCTYSPSFIFAASSPFHLGITLVNNKFHKALAFFKKSKKTRQEAWHSVQRECSQQTTVKGENKSSLYTCFLWKRNTKTFLEAFTTFLWLTDWLTYKNTLEQNAVLTTSSVSQQAPITAFTLLSMSFGLPTRQISCSPIFKSLDLLTVVSTAYYKE